MGQAFEFTPGGIVPMTEPAASPTGVINAATAVANLRSLSAAPPLPSVGARPEAKASTETLKPVSRKTYIAQLKARLRLLEREIRSKAALEREAADLRRMLAVAKQPPAQVADIHARKTG